ncbi:MULTISPECIES: hypothetical protein [Kitasatospora]|uniref:hypothetical protein n=1 Tax=Kitasatospora TaxID=2063 RepID=UPI000B27658F|nr:MULTISPECIES: hypothetical protein [Kitasatospora]
MFEHGRPGGAGRSGEVAGRRRRWRVVRRTVALYFVRGMATAAGGATVTGLLAWLVAQRG